MNGEARLGVDLGGTKALAVLVAGGAVIWSRTEATGRSFGPLDATGLLCRLLREIADDPSLPEPASVGLGVPGLVRPDSGVVRSSVILDGWNDVAISDAVEEATGLPCMADNDVNHAARAEWWVRGGCAGAGPDLLFLGIGTGVGGALVLGGRVWAGLGGAAGEIGHVAGGTPSELCDCGHPGCISVSVGGRALERRLGLPSGGLADAVSAGHPAANALLVEGARRLGAVAADAMNLLDLPLVVLGGGVARHEAFVDAVAEGFSTRALPEVAGSCSVEAARAGYGAASFGAALAAGGIAVSPGRTR